MKCLQQLRFSLAVSLILLLLVVESADARPFGFPRSKRMPAFAKRAFLAENQEAAEASTTASSTTTTSVVLPLRGGSDMHHHHAFEAEAFEQEEYDEDEEAHIPPRISAADMAIALRWTGEINRRIQSGSRPVVARHGPLVSSLSQNNNYDDDVAAANYHSTAVRGGGEEQQEVTSTSLDASTEFLTLFHAKTPRSTGHGADRWGPSLEAYVEHVCHALGLTPGSAPELSLALMYLDRATSAETPRSNGVPPVPFLQPRTVHRLVLAALLLATQTSTTTSGWPLPVLLERVESLVGIPGEQLSQMLQWMQGALGDPGYFVSYYSIQNWRQVWDATAHLRNLLQPQQTQEAEQDYQELTTPHVPPAKPLERREAEVVAADQAEETRETQQGGVEEDLQPLVGVEAA